MEENGLSEKEVRANFAKPSPNLLHALDALFYHGIITLDDHGNYKVAGQMFHDWFKANISSRFQKSHSNNVQREEMKMEEELFDVFLSHSHSDADAVEMLAKRLEDTEGLKVWLDKWTLIPGEFGSMKWLGVSPRQGLALYS